MPIKRYRKDPRTAAEQRADADILRLSEKSELLDVDESNEQNAIDHVQRRFQARREMVALLGKELGILRRAHGLTQNQVALALGTKKSNVSRLESGLYGGLTIEYFLAVLDAFHALVQTKAINQRAPREGNKKARSAQLYARG